jgi:hypothetical protein
MADLFAINKWRILSKCCLNFCSYSGETIGSQSFNNVYEKSCYLLYDSIKTPQKIGNSVIHAKISESEAVDNDYYFPITD